MYKGNEVFKGLSKAEVVELIPDIKIDEQAKITDEGWYALDHVETMQECMERAKEAIRIFKQLATEYQGQDRTVFAVSHGAFLAALYCLIT